MIHVEESSRKTDLSISVEHRVPEVRKEETASLVSQDHPANPARLESQDLTDQRGRLENQGLYLAKRAVVSESVAIS